MDFRILGPLEVLAEGRPVQVGFGRQRTLLVMLLLRANQFVGFDELVEAIWGDAAPENPRAAVHTCVTRLRKVLGSQPVIESSADGFRLVVDEDDIDLGRFESAVRGARAAGAEVEVLRSALDLWRGEPLVDVQSDYLRREVVPQLVDRRLQVVERRIELDLVAGHYHVTLPELQELTAAHPLRERLWAQLMTALYGSGRQAEALLAYTEIRNRLVEELGVEPGEALRQAHREVLADRPDGPSAWRVECQLPLEIADFVGRDDEVAQVVSSLREGSSVPVLTISGLPGMGKSALAVHAAHRLIDEYPDGQWFLRLNGANAGPRPSAELLAELLRTAGVSPVAIPSELDDRAALLRSRLADRRVLLVFDDAGSDEQVAPLLPGRPGCAVLVTSRFELAGLSVWYGASRLLLDPLPPQQANDLLMRIVGARRYAGSETAAAELVDLCGRLPLALRIAAANLVSRPGLRIDGYVADLRAGDRLAKLRTRGEGGVAVRAAFDVSYRALSDEARRVFRLLGLLPGADFTAEAARALMGCSAAKAEDLLDRLVSASLLGYENAGRYRFHDLIRAYATDRAHKDERPEDRAQGFRRLADWYLHTLHAAVTASAAMLYMSPLGPVPDGVAPLEFVDHNDAIRWLDSERANYLAFIDHVAEHGPAEYTWLLADAARPELHGLYRTAEMERTATLGLACARQMGDRRAEAVMLLALGALKSIVIPARFDESVVDLSSSRTVAREISETGIEASAVNSLAGLYVEAGLPEEGARAAEAALELSERGAEQGMARTAGALMWLGRASYLLGDLTRAVDLLENAHDRFTRQGPLIAAVVLAAHLGSAYRETAHFDKSLKCFQHVVSSVRADQSTYERGVIGMAAVNCAIGNMGLALKCATESLSRLQHQDVPRYEVEALVVLGAIDLAEGRQDSAIQHLTRGHEIARRRATPIEQLKVLIGLALASSRSDLAADAVALAHKQRMRLFEAKALTALAEIQVVHGQLAAARESAELALVMHRESGCRLELGKTLVVLGDAGAGAEHWLGALEVFEAIGSPLAGVVRERL